MRNASLWRALLGVEKAVVEDIEFDEDGSASCWWLMCGQARARAGAVVAAERLVRRG